MGLSPSSSQPIVRASPIGQLTIAVLVFAILPFALFGIPYLYRSATNSWSGSMFSNRPSLTGAWVGVVSSRKDAPDAAMLLNIHTKILTMGSHITGSAETCEANGERQHYAFTLGDVREGKRVAASMRDTENVTGGGSLAGVWSGDRLEVQFSRAVGTLHGTLHKGARTEFHDLCRKTGGNR